MKKVSVIIANYNTSEILNGCLLNLKQIRSSEYAEMEIIVVDNASPDDSVEMMRTQHPDVLLIENENRGLADAYNRGFARCTGEFVIYLGTDAFPKSGVISGLVSYLEQNPEVGAATPKLLTRDGKPDMDAHRGFPTPWAAITHFTKLNRFFPKSKIFNQYFIGWEELDKPHEIDLCISHFMILPRRIQEQVGPWDTTFFLYGEDVDMCYRIKQAGFKIMYLAQFEAIHFKGASVGVRKETADITKTSPEHRKKMRKKSVESMKIFYKKHYSKKYPPFVTGIVLWAIDVMGVLRS